jgi:hypothetical protein
MYSAPTVRFNNDGFDFRMAIVPIEDFTLDELMDTVIAETRFFGTYSYDGHMQFDLRNEKFESVCVEDDDGILHKIDVVLYNPSYRERVLYDMMVAFGLQAANPRFERAGDFLLVMNNDFASGVF